MKKPFLRFPEMKGRWEPATEARKGRGSPLGPKVWLLYHLSIPVLLGLSLFFAGPLRINTSLTEMLPQSGSIKAVEEAEKIMGDKSGRQAVILAAAVDFETAKKGAALLSGELEKLKSFDDVSLYYDSASIADFTDYLYKYRFVIAGSETRNLLETGRAGEIAEDALASAFGAFTFVPLNNIETDPFLLANRRVEEFITSPLLFRGNLSPKEDVLAANKDGIWYVMLRLSLSPEVVSVTGKNSGVQMIWDAAGAVKQAAPGLEFYFSGVPFHSYESSSSAQREISIISTVTLLVILLMYLYVFRSPLPVIFSMAAIWISLAMATATALLIFREIHIISFVFGTTLIGICEDYSVHFFIHWKGNLAFKSGVAIRSFLLKSLVMCFISTEICFAIFLLAPFLILKQFAVFCMAGVLSSFLTPLCLYSYLKIPAEDKREIRFLKGKLFLGIKKISVPLFFKIILIVVLTASSLGILFFHPLGMKIENNVSSLYTPSLLMLESEKRASEVLDYGSRFWYFIVSGSSPEETLEHEENLTQRLEEEIRRGNLGSYLGTTVFVPLVKTQKETYAAMKALLPLAEEQFSYLGFPPEYAESFREEFKAGESYCLPEDAHPMTGVSTLWIGESGGKYYSCVMPFHAGDEALFRSIAGEYEFVHFINKAKDIGRDLDTLTRTMLIFFAAAYLVVSVIVFFIYSWKDSLRICAVPLLLVLCTWAVLAASGISMSFFPVAALVLVFGLGLDYIFFMVQRKSGDTLIFVAVVLSSLTTIVSFGALAFSSFKPVHMFGLTVLTGLSAALISSMLLQGKKD